MASHAKTDLQKYKRILEERYEALFKQLEGSESGMPRDGWGGSVEEYRESHRYINPLDLRLAADDFINALKEVKKLK